MILVLRTPPAVLPPVGACDGGSEPRFPCPPRRRAGVQLWLLELCVHLVLPPRSAHGPAGPLCPRYGCRPACSLRSASRGRRVGVGRALGMQAARSLSENNFRIEHLQFLWNLPEQPSTPRPSRFGRRCERRHVDAASCTVHIATAPSRARHAVGHVHGRRGGHGVLHREPNALAQRRVLAAGMSAGARQCIMAATFKCP